MLVRRVTRLDEDIRVGVAHTCNASVAGLQFVRGETDIGGDCPRKLDFRHGEIESVVA